MKKLEMVCYFAMVIISLWLLLPIVLIAFGSFTPRLELYRWPKPLLPTRFTLDSFVSFAQAYGVMDALWNSIIAGLLTVVLSISIGAPAGYALARFRFRGKNIFQIGVLVTRMFPIAVLSIPLAVTYIRLGLYDTVYGVAFVHTVFAFPFAILISMSIFASIPVEFEEAALVLGCSRLRAFVKIALPLAAPGLAATAIFAFVISWNEVFAATLLTLYNRTLPALIVARSEAPTLDFLYASAFFMILPAIIFIYIVRKQLLRMWGIAVR
jgi:multiple sugar transport system permease protein